MHVTALAEALVGARRSDGAISLHDLEARLSRAGLDELARAVASLWRRARIQREDDPDGPVTPWM
jgi:hypothetical protein